MNETQCITCPYCFEAIYVEADPSAGDTTLEYVEDCHVCCQPIVIRIRFDADGAKASVRREND